MSHVRSPELAKAFEDIVDRLEDSLDFLKVIGAEKGSAIQNVDLWTSHEVSIRQAGVGLDWIGLSASLADTASTNPDHRV